MSDDFEDGEATIVTVTFTADGRTLLDDHDTGIKPEDATIFVGMSDTTAEDIVISGLDGWDIGEV